MLTLDFYKSGDGTQSDFDERPSTDANDFGFFAVSGGTTKTATKLQDVLYGYVNNNASQSGFSTGFTETPYNASTMIGDLYFMETPYLTYTFTASAEADYTFGFGITDAFTGNDQGASGRPSGLSVDNVRLIAGPVPEPATLSALAGAAVLLMRRRRA